MILPPAAPGKPQKSKGGLGVKNNLFQLYPWRASRPHGICFPDVQILIYHFFRSHQHSPSLLRHFMLRCKSERGMLFKRNSIFFWRMLSCTPASSWVRCFRKTTPLSPWYKSCSTRLGSIRHSELPPTPATERAPSLSQLLSRAPAEQQHLLHPSSRRAYSAAPSSGSYGCLWTSSPGLGAAASKPGLLWGTYGKDVNSSNV